MKAILKKVFIPLFVTFAISAFWSPQAYAEKDQKSEGKKKTSSVKAGGQSPGPVAAPMAGYPDPGIAEIQKELQDILKIHKDLQVQHQEQMKEIQRIREQAKVHEKILTDLNQIKKTTLPKPKTVDRDELIRLEKIKLIKAQADQNKAILNEITAKAEKEKAAKIEKVEGKKETVAEKPATTRSETKATPAPKTTNPPPKEKSKQGGWWWQPKN